MDPLPVPRLKARFKDAAARHGLTRNQLYRLIADDAIPVYKIGRNTHVDLEALDAAIERRRVTVLPNRDEMRRRRKIGIERKQAARRSPTLLATPT